MNIKDRDVRLAIETLINEFENAEENHKQFDIDEEASNKRIAQLEDRIAELEDQVKDLEEALAEAHLTGDADEQTKRETDQLQTRCGTDVSDPASD